MANIGISQSEITGGGGGGGISSITPNNQTGTSYAILNSDRGKVVEIQNATASTIVALTIAQAGTAGSFASGWYCYILNKGSNAAQLTPATSTIGGYASMFIPVGATVLIYSDGTNYQVIAGGNSITGTKSGMWMHDLGNISEGNTTGGGAGLNNVIVNPLNLEAMVGVSQITIDVATINTNHNVVVGLYDANGNKITQAVFSLNATGGVTTSLGSGILLLPGAYQTCFGFDNAGGAVVSRFQNSAFTIWNKVDSHKAGGMAANTLSGTTMPSTLGTVTTGSGIGTILAWMNG